MAAERDDKFYKFIGMVTETIGLITLILAIFSYQNDCIDYFPQ
jgi:hypothetical protein